VKVKEYSVVGTRMPRIDALDKVTGKAVYTTDIEMPGMLHAKFLRSSMPHARVANVDTTRAKNLSGVKAVLTVDDTPKIKFGLSPITADQLPLTDKVRYAGDAVAVVAAIDNATAEMALELIKVDYEPLPAVFDPIEAMRSEAIRIHEHLESNIARHICFEAGNVEQGFAESEYIFEDRFTTQPQCHCCLEPRCCIASFDASGKLTVWSTTQETHTERALLSAACDIPIKDIRVIKPYLGGAFGLKTDLEPMEPIVVFLAKATGRPVKMTYSREEEFASKTRHATISELKMGVKKDGTLIAKQARVIMDNGAYNSQGPNVLSYNCGFFCSLYRVPNIKYEGDLVYTNKIPGGAFRGYGTQQATFAQESLMDEVAEGLGIDPKELRLKNANRPGETTANRFTITSCGLKECIQDSADIFQWEPNGQKKDDEICAHGAGMACGMHTGMASRGPGRNHAGAVIKLDVDGSFVLAVGASEIGQGSNTILSQIAAELLDVPIEQINLVESDTALTLPTLGSFGSRTTYCDGLAVFRAANKLKFEMLKLAAEILGTEAEDVQLTRGKIFVKISPQMSISLAQLASASYFERSAPLCCSGYFDEPRGREWDRLSLSGYPGEAFAFFNHVAEVDVNKRNGQVRVTRFVAAHDVGKAINKMSTEGQIYGGVVMGIGWALTENPIYDQGQFLNPNFRDYKILTSMDIPRITPHLVETIDSKGPFGAKGIGEAVMIPTAPSIANALYNATGIRFRDLPITSEMVLRALKEKVSE